MAANVRWSLRAVDRKTLQAASGYDFCTNAEVIAAWLYSGVGTLQVTQGVTDSGCCDGFDEIEPLVHDLALFRLDGSSDAATEPMAIFEITGVEDQSFVPGSPTRSIVGEHRSRMWFGGTSLGDRVHDLAVTGQIPKDALTYWVDLWEEADDKDEFGVTLVSGDEIGITRRLEIERGEPLRNTLQNLTSLGVGWVLWGRILYVGDDAVPTSKWATLPGRCWENKTPTAAHDALNVCNHVTVRGGADADGNTVVVTSPTTVSAAVTTAPDATGALREIGLRQRTLDVGDVVNEGELRDIAERFLEDHQWPTVLAITADNSLEECDCEVPIRDLIPGRTFDVQTLGCLDGLTSMRIDQLVVTIQDCQEATVSVATTTTSNFGETLQV